MHALLYLSVALVVFSGLGFTFLGGAAFLKAIGAGLVMVAMLGYGLGALLISTALMFGLVAAALMAVLGCGGVDTKIDFKWPL